MTAITPHIYLRILGYVITITMHVSNIAIVESSLHGEVMKNDIVRHYSEMSPFFFTCWSFSFQLIYSVIALYTDIMTLKNAKVAGFRVPKNMDDCRDAIFTIFVWPSTVFVCTMFWTLFYYDRSLVFPKDIDLAITSTSNHIMHTCIVPASIWEMMFRPRKTPRTHKWHLLGVLLIEAAYIIVLRGVFAIQGVWVYPIFSILGETIYFYVFFGFVAVYLTVIYYTQWTLNSFLWESKENREKLC